MSNYSQEIIDYLIKSEENLEGLILAKNKYDDVRKYLITSFWDNVFQKIEELLKGSDWKVRKTNYFDKQSRIFLEDTSKNSIGIDKLLICWERLSNIYPYYGIKVMPGEWQDKINETLLKFKDRFQNFEDPDDDFIFWGSIEGLEFEDDKLINLIPKNREKYVKNCVDSILDLYNTLIRAQGGISIYESLKHSLKI